MEIKSRRCDSNKSTVWYRGHENHFHREDGPARIYDDGTEVWYYNNRYFGSGYLSNTFRTMPLNLFLAYCRWEYKKNGN